MFADSSPQDATVVLCESIKIRNVHRELCGALWARQHSQCQTGFNCKCPVYFLGREDQWLERMAM